MTQLKKMYNLKERIIPKKKYLKYNIGMKSRVEIVTNNP